MHTPVKCSFCGLDRPGGVAGSTPAIYICPGCIQLTHDLIAGNSLPISTKTVQEFMAAFIAAWPSGSATDLARFFSKDAEYRNGPLEPVKGRNAIVDNLASMMAVGGEVDADIIHMVADGSVVMTERVDYIKLGEKTAALRIAGVFEVHDGVITAWRDYFDTTEFAAQLSDVT